MKSSTLPSSSSTKGSSVLALPSRSSYSIIQDISPKKEKKVTARSLSTARLDSQNTLNLLESGSILNNNEPEIQSKCTTYFNKNILNPLKEAIQSGITPEGLALSLSLGVVGGLFPIIGLTVALCVILAFIFKVNPLIIQVANFVVMPLELILIPSMVNIGRFLLGRYNYNSQLEPFNVNGAIHGLQNDFVATLISFGPDLAAAVFAWSLISPVIAFILYILLTPLCRILIRKWYKPDDYI
jgi:uncharacterized protein (DUF2062 family)